VLIVVVGGSYLVLSQVDHPLSAPMRLKQKLRLEARTAHILLESLGSIRASNSPVRKAFFRQRVFIENR